MTCLLCEDEGLVCETHPHHFAALVIEAPRFSNHLADWPACLHSPARVRKVLSCQIKTIGISPAPTMQR